MSPSPTDPSWPMGVRTTYTFKIDMTCDGCAKAITESFQKLPYVKEVKCDVPAQHCEVVTWTETDEHLENQLINQIKPWAEAADKKVELISLAKVA